MLKKSFAALLSALILISVFPFGSLTVSAKEAQADNGDVGFALSGAEGTEDYNRFNCIPYLESVGVDIDSLHQTLLNGVSRCETSIDISGYRIPTDGFSAVRAYANSCLSDYFPFAVSDFRYRYYTRSNTLSTLELTYHENADTPEKLQDCLAEVKTVVDRLLDGIGDNNALSDVEKALLVHDRLALNLDYDYQTYYNIDFDRAAYTAYGALVKHKAVCQGYSEAYSYLMNKIGIPTDIVSVPAMNHAWNVVYIENIPYYVDVTWDDYYGGVKHVNFLRSADGMTETGHTITDKERFFSGDPVNDTRYDDCYWQRSRAPFQLVNHKIYYVDNSKGTLNLADSSHSVIFSSEEADPNASLSLLQNTLLFSYQGKVYKVNTSSDTVDTTPLTGIGDLGAKSMTGVTGDCEWTLRGSVLTVNKGSVLGYYCYLELPLRALVDQIVISAGVTEITDYAFAYFTGVKNIAIPDSVTVIGDYAFYRCTSLEEIVIPDSVRSIGSYAFAFCTAAKRLAVPEAVLKEDVVSSGAASPGGGDEPDSVGIGSYAFAYCYAMTTAHTPNSIAVIGDHAFYYCQSLNDLTFAETVREIDEQAFFNCYKLKNVLVPDTVQSIKNQALGYLNSGKTADLVIRGHQGTEAERYAKENGFIFRSPEEVVTWSLKGKTLTVGGIGYMDNYSYGDAPWGNDITRAVIKKGVLSIGSYAFYNCEKLTAVTIPDSVTVIGDYAFYYCTSLEEIAIPDGVTSIGDYAFNGCDFDTVIIPDSVRSIGANAFPYRCVILGKKGSAAQQYAKDHNCTFVPVGEEVAGETGSWSWRMDSDLTLTVKGAGEMDDNLEQRDDGHWYVKAAPWGRGVRKAVIENGITRIGGYAFYDCEKLADVSIPDSVTEIASNAFYGCNSLKSVTIPSSVTEIGWHSLGYFNEWGSLEEKKVDGFTIYGYRNTEASRYARENGFVFVDLSASETLLGDVDSDGHITVLDATTIQKTLAKITTAVYVKAAADADGDGRITVLDATAIQKWLARLPANQKIGEPIIA